MIIALSNEKISTKVYRAEKQRIQLSPPDDRGSSEKKS